MHEATSKVENLAHGCSCKLKFVHGCTIFIFTKQATLMKRSTSLSYNLMNIPSGLFYKSIPIAMTLLELSVSDATL
jgi:hypothetical protein